jgi:hypothetical protein
MREEILSPKVSGQVGLHLELSQESLSFLELHK